VTEGDLFPGGIPSFGVSQGPGSVTVDHVNAGTGTQSITVVGVPLNAVVNIPPFTPGTFAPITVTFTTPIPGAPTDFTLRAASTFHSVNIRVRCGTVLPTPTPVATPTPTPVACSTFTNPTPIIIPANGTSGNASPYPSNINVAGVAGTVTKVRVSLNNLNHTFPDDIDVLLVGPGGQSVILMSDAGGSDDVAGVTLAFDDAAANNLPNATQIVSGTFQPTDFGLFDIFPAPAPAGLYGTTLSVFNGVNPNGMWRLFVVDDLAGDSGNINGGWTLSITTNSCQPISTPELFESLNAATEIESLFNLPSMKFNQIIN